MNEQYYQTAQLWCQTTEKILGSMIKKKKIIVSDTTIANYRFQVQEIANNHLRITGVYRDSLRFTDMGAGRGYHKGRKIGASLALFKPRVRKYSLNRPLYSRIGALSGIFAITTAEKILNSFDQLKK